MWLELFIKKVILIQKLLCNTKTNAARLSLVDLVFLGVCLDLYSDAELAWNFHEILEYFISFCDTRVLIDVS